MTPIDDCAFAVIGAGATGSVVAAGLARRFPEARIALIEAGNRRPGLVNIVPMLSGFAPFARGANWMHAAEGPAGPQLLYQGRMPGGSSEINGMVVSLGEAADYAAWADAAGPDWSFDKIRAAFGSLGYAPQEEPCAKGPMPVAPTIPFGPLPDAFLAAAEQAGFPLVADLNAVAGDRFGRTCANIRDGRRISARRAFLSRPPATITLWRGWTAERLILRAGRVVSVLLRRGAEHRTLAVSDEAILTAGAVQSAALLLRSGVGAADMLRQAGIAPILDQPEIGQNLQNHPSWLMRAPTTGGSLRGLVTHPVAAASALARWLAVGRGPLAQAIFQAAGYFKPREAPCPGRAQVVLSPALFPPASPGRNPGLPRRHGVSLAVQQGAPFSRGRVLLRPDGRLDIRTGALDDPRDAAFLRAAIADIRDILLQPAFARWLVNPAALTVPTEAEVRAGLGTAYHMCGTLRMGRDPGAPVAPDLRVNGVDGLRVADASVMPGIPNAALHFPSMMIAARAAAFIGGQADNAPEQSPEKAGKDRYRMLDL